MKNLKWTSALAVVASFVLLAGCTPEAAKTEPESGSEPTKETTSTESKPGEVTPAEKTETASATKATDPQDPKIAEAKAAAAKAQEAKAAETAQAKPGEAGARSPSDSPKKVQSEKEETLVAEATTQNLSAQPSTRNTNVKPAAKPVQKDPPNVDKTATKTSFVGKWKRFMDAKTREQHAKIAGVMKKRGKPVFPTDNILTMNADGTFVWDDNATVTGRKVTGTWSVVSGKAQFVVKTVNGKAPDASDAKAFDASVAKGGKTLFRQNSERGRYDKV